MAKLEKTLRGMRICVTGKFAGIGTREDVKRFIRERGGIVQQQVNGRTDYLVVGDIHTGGKVKRDDAKRLQTKLLSERNFMTMATDADTDYGTLNKTFERIEQEEECKEKRHITKGVVVDKKAVKATIDEADETWENLNI